MAVSRQPAELCHALGAPLPQAELFCLLHLGSLHLGGPLQRLCNEALQSWSFRSSMLQAVLLICVQQLHQFIAMRFQPMQPYAPGNDALEELIAYISDGSEMAMFFLENGIDLGSLTQIGGQGHRLLLWAVGRANVAVFLLKIGVPAVFLPEPNKPNRYLYPWYDPNRESVLVQAVINFQKDMVALWIILPMTPTDLLRSDRDDIIGMLLNHGADPNVKIDNGRSLLSCLRSYPPPPFCHQHKPPEMLSSSANTATELQVLPGHTAPQNLPCISLAPGINLTRYRAVRPNLSYRDNVSNEASSCSCDGPIFPHA